MNAAAQAKSWMNHPDHFAVWFIRQLRNLKVLDAITSGAELKGIVLNQRKSYYGIKKKKKKKSRLCLPITNAAYTHWRAGKMRDEGQKDGRREGGVGGRRKEEMKEGKRKEMGGKKRRSYKSRNQYL